MEGNVIIDLFSGVGGLSYGIIKAEFTVALAIDNDLKSLKTYKLNHPETVTL